MADEIVELAVPFRVFETLLDPAVDSWAADTGLPAPHFRTRGRGQQAVYEVSVDDALAVCGRVLETAPNLEDQTLRNQARSWVRRTQETLGVEVVASSRRSRGTRRASGDGDRTADRRRVVTEAVRHYLEYVDTGQVPLVTSGRPEEQIRSELADVDSRLEVTDDVLGRLELLAARRRLAAELEPTPVGTESELERDFVRHASAFARDHGYDAAVFVEFGVTPEVLVEAGLASSVDELDGIGDR